MILNKADIEHTLITAPQCYPALSYTTVYVKQKKRLPFEQPLLIKNVFGS